LLICGSDTFIIVCTSEEFEQVNSPTLSKLYGVPDVRLSISIEMIKQIPKALSHTCSSKYEAVLFTVALYLAFNLSVV
jgi:hypothetical protein